MRKFLMSVLLLIVTIQFSIAQDNNNGWVQLMLNPNSNFYDVQDAFYEYWKDKNIEKGKGYKQFKRYEEFMRPRVYPTGYLPNEVIQSEVLSAIESKQNSSLRSSNSSNWLPLGPTTVPTNGLGYQNAGIGRVNCVRFDPQNSNIIWIGTPGGGLWKSTNGGTSWSSNTDALSTLGVSDIAIHPSNSNIMYIATGDADGADTYSIGVLKSIDAGQTWNPTGLTFTTSASNRISRLLINPTNPDILIATTNNGIYRTTNAGTSWTSTLTGTFFFDAEFKPGDPNVVYAASYSFSGTGKIYYSTNAGQSYTQATGIPTSGVLRIALAVSAASPSTVYALLSSSSNYGYNGLYKSTNSGVSFSSVNSSPNLLGWNETGSDVGGQGWYDLALAVSPLDANQVFVGGVNLWKSTNGGTSFTITGHWYGGGGNPFIHADQHMLEFQPNSSVIFSANDGGLRKSTNAGGLWTDLSNGLQITQFYRISTATENANIVYAGAQDNGTNRFITNAWTAVLGGDGMQPLVDHTNSNIVYASVQYGGLNRSTNGGASFTGIKPSAAPDGAWITPYVLHPTTTSTIFAGYDKVYKSTNSGTTWTALTANLPTGELHEILKISVSNPNVLYAGKGNRLYRTTDGGTTWTSIVTGLPTASAYLTEIAISNTDPNKIWATFSGYSASNKVFASTNGGSTWTNISSGLPNLPVNCIVYENNSNDAIYVGTDVGVYYRNATTPWTAFMTNLPNVKVSDLEIHYGTSKIRAGTYGRGLWESPLYVMSVAPSANFSASQTTANTGTNITFSDQSTNTPTSWQWTFTGATPSTSSLQNPVVVYNTPGVYNVKLKVTNAAGADSLTKSSYITINQAGQATCAGWNVQATGFSAVSRGINDINIVNQNIAWAVAYDGSGAAATIREYTKTTNGGTSWTPGVINNTGLGTSYGLANIHAYNADTAWASIYPTTATVTLQGVYYTTNGGTTWTRQAGASFSTSTSFINVVHFFNKNDGVALGDPAGGYLEMYTTSNAGTTWTRVPQANIPAVLAADEYGTVGYFTALGNTIWYPTYKGRIYKSTDKGLTWTVSNGPFPNVNSIVDLAFKDQNNGLMICNSGTGSNGLIYSTSNGGTSWSIVNTNFNAIVDKNAITFVPGTTNTYYISGANAATASTGTAYTTDGGLNWTLVDNIQHTCVRFYDQSTGWAGGFNTSNTVGGIFKSQVSNLTATIVPQSSTTICFGEFVTLKADSNVNYTYKWYRNNSLIANATSFKINANQAGDYKVEIQENNCFVESAPVTVTVLASPAVPSIAGPASFCTGDSITISSSNAANYTWYRNSILIPNATTSTLKVKESGLYQVEVSNANNCKSISQAFTVTAIDRPVKVSLSSNASNAKCEGDTVELTVNTNASIQWYRNNLIIPGATQNNLMVLIEGDYHVELSNTAICKTYTDTLNISFIPIPAKPSITQVDSILSTDSAAAYQWYKDNVAIANSNSQEIKITEEGNYSVEVFDLSNTCSNVSDQFFAQLVGLNLNKNLFNAIVKPNPNNGSFVISFNSNKSDVFKVQMINMLGQVVKEMKLDSKTNGLNEIYINEEKAGIYLIRVFNAENVYEEKVIIQ